MELVRTKDEESFFMVDFWPGRSDLALRVMVMSVCDERSGQCDILLAFKCAMRYR